MKKQGILKTVLIITAIATLTLCLSGVVVGSAVSRVYDFAIPRTATVVVAASDATAWSKAQADYVCDGIDDQIEEQQAVNALAFTGGIIQKSEGTFYPTGPVDIEGRQGITIKGTGMAPVLDPIGGTIIRLPDGANFDVYRVNPTDTSRRSRMITFKDFTIDGNGNATNSISNGFYLKWFDTVTIENVRIYYMKGNGIFVDFPPAGWDIEVLRINKCIIQNNLYCGIKINAPAEGLTHLWIMENQIGGNGRDCVGGESDGIQINAQGNALGIIISENALTANRGHGIRVKGCPNVQIVSNSVMFSGEGNKGVFDGVSLEDNGAIPCSDIIIASNRCSDYGVNIQQRYGVAVNGYAQRIVLGMNNLYGNMVGDLYIAPTASVIIP